MEILLELVSFTLKGIVVVVAIAAVFAIITARIGMSRKHEDKHGYLEIRRINDDLESFKDIVSDALDPDSRHPKVRRAKQKAKKKEQKAKLKARKAEKSSDTEEEQEKKPSVFVLDFRGDIEANDIKLLRNEINAIVQKSTSDDEVLVKVYSPGGLVHAYGLAASQLLRIKESGAKLIVAVDGVAASGGYMMACVADKIIAAPFAVIGSIGVMAEIPNFNRLLKKFDIDYDVHTAGKYKRTLSFFGENTEEGRKKFIEELDETHQLFREFVSTYRSEIDIEEISTGETWYGQRALDLKLVDEICTSDQYILTRSEDANILEVKWVLPKAPFERLTTSMASAVRRVFEQRPRIF